jgi:hypothetical protein
VTIEMPTIVSLQAYREKPVHSAVSQVEAYWNSLRGTRLVPARADIDPRGIAPALEYSFILERVAKGLGRFRLAGMHLNDLMGMEVRGMPLTAMILPESRPLVSEALEAVFDEPSIVKMTLRSASSMGRPPVEAQLLLLPLRSDLGDVSRVLGCLVSDGKIGRTPRRFDVIDQTRRTLVGQDDIRPLPKRAIGPGVEEEPASSDEPAFAEEPSSFKPSKILQKKAPHLTIVK